MTRLLALSYALLALTAAADNNNPGTFVHLFEWSWPAVANECETVLGPKGYEAVQISPPMEHIQGSHWWTRYQPVSYQLVSRSGDEAAFQDMVKRCNAAGVKVYADAVINHVAAGSGTGVAGTPYGNPQRSTKDFDQDDFHHDQGDSSRNCQVSNYQDIHNVQYCDLVGLPDLCTGCSKVQQTLGGYIRHLASLGVAGIRVDAAKHQDPGELETVLQAGGAGSGNASSFFVFQEVIEGDAVQASSYYGNGAVTEFRFATSGIGPSFKNDGGNDVKNLRTLGESWGLMPSASAVVFLDNHDTQRGGAPLTYKDGDLYFLANVFMLAWPYGYPKVMSSYYFNDHDQGPPGNNGGGNNGGGGGGGGGSEEDVACGDGQNWVCEHRRPEAANMVQWRKLAGTASVDNWWNNGQGDQIAFSRGGKAFVALNRDSSNSLSAMLQTGLPAGTYCDVISSSSTSSSFSYSGGGGGECDGNTVNVDSSGRASITVQPMKALALHVQATTHAAARGSRGSADATAVAKVAANATTASPIVNMTTCKSKCDNAGGSGDCRTYLIKAGACYSPPKLFPGDPQWGSFDVIDECTTDASGAAIVNRTFFASEDGSCRSAQDGFTVNVEECVGPFGRPRPWGLFSCGKGGAASMVD